MSVKVRPTSIILTEYMEMVDVELPSNLKARESARKKHRGQVYLPWFCIFLQFGLFCKLLYVEQIPAFPYHGRKSFAVVEQSFLSSFHTSVQFQV